MPEYSSGDRDRAADVPDAGAPPGRPDEWVAPGVTQVPTTPAGPESLTLAYTVTVNDITATVLDHRATLKLYEARMWRTGWLRGLPMLGLTLGLVLVTNLFMFELDVTWSVLSTLALGALFALVRWSQIDHAIKRSLPAALEQQALRELAQRGDERRIVADAAGVTLADAAATARFGWGQVRLSETERHILLTVGPATWAIPKWLGEPLATFVQFARSHGAS